MRIAQDGVYTMYLVHPDMLDVAEELEVTDAPNVKAAWERLLGEAQANYSADMRVRGVTDGYGVPVLDFGRKGTRLGDCELLP